MQKPAKLISKKTGIKKGVCAAALAAVLYVVAAVAFVFMSYNNDVKGGKGSNEEISVRFDNESF